MSQLAETITRHLHEIAQQLIDKHRSTNSSRSSQRTATAQGYLDAIRRGENPTFPAHRTGESFGQLLYSAVEIASLIPEIRSLSAEDVTEQHEVVIQNRWYDIDPSDGRWEAIGEMKTLSLSILESLRAQNERDVGYEHDIETIQMFLQRLLDELELLKVNPADVQDVAEFANAAQSLPIFTDAFKLECFQLAGCTASIMQLFMR